MGEELERWKQKHRQRMVRFEHGLLDRLAASLPDTGENKHGRKHRHVAGTGGKPGHLGGAVRALFGADPRTFAADRDRRLTQMRSTHKRRHILLIKNNFHTRDIPSLPHIRTALIKQINPAVVITEYIKMSGFTLIPAALITIPHKRLSKDLPKKTPSSETAQPICCGSQL